MLHQFSPYLKACLAVKSRKLESASAVSEVDEISWQTQEKSLPSSEPISGITTEDREAQLTAAMGEMTRKKTAAELEELRNTPCYAFIDGKCTSSSCLRSHDKKQISAYLADKQKKLQRP